jgi:hypothetical protein
MEHFARLLQKIKKKKFLAGIPTLVRQTVMEEEKDLQKVVLLMAAYLLVTIKANL